MLSIIEESLVKVNEKCGSKNSVLKEMVNLLYKYDRITDADKFYNEVIAREKVKSTGIGNEIAIPHAKSEYVKIISVSILVCKKGIKFNSLDKKPVKLIFLIASPAALTKTYLQIVAKIARILKTDEWKEKFLNSHNSKDVIKVLKDFDKAFPDRLNLRLKKGHLLLL